MSSKILFDIIEKPHDLSPASEGFLLLKNLAEATGAGLGLRLAKPAPPSGSTIFAGKN